MEKQNKKKTVKTGEKPVNSPVNEEKEVVEVNPVPEEPVEENREENNAEKVFIDVATNVIEAPSKALNKVEEKMMAMEVPEPAILQADEAVDQDHLSEYDHKMIDNDIKFKAPFSYRHFKMLGWLALAVGMASGGLALIVTLALFIEKISPETASRLTTVSDIMSMFSALPLPLFMISNFAIILQQKNQYKKLLLTYGAIVIAIYVGFLIVYYHYIVGIVGKLNGVDFITARQQSIDALADSQASLVINVFIDLLCCALIMYFIDYTPKKIFQGKKIIIFRLMVLIPILYEVMSIIFVGFLQLSAAFEDITFILPLEVLPLLGKKPIGMIFAFVAICLYVKLRYKRYLKKGGTPEGYQLFRQTNRNSFKFAKNMAIIFAIVGFIDLVLFFSISMGYSANVGGDPVLVQTFGNILQAFSLGRSACLLLVIPFVLLFSYLKTHKNPGLDKLIPLGGILFVIFALFETAYLSFLFIM
ncbi:MAG: hypothetical protein E7178_05550 [Erysipelotrichaceae bacterium]|nr:hypothetical protein [Erysipelotrichaceae bacterium]